MEQLIVGVGAARRKRVKELDSLVQEILSEVTSGEGTIGFNELMKRMNERLAERKENIATENEVNVSLKTAETAGYCRKMESRSRPGEVAAALGDSSGYTAA